MPWNVDLNRALTRIFDAGLVQFLIGRYIPAKYMDQREDFSAPPTAFRPEHVLGAILILAVGCVLATAVFAAEACNMFGFEGRKMSNKP